MPIFRINGEKMQKLSILPLSKERILQRLLEDNLGEALGLRFLASEYPTTTGGRIDTLALDEASAPVIIEYKKNRNDNVINQALSYLLWLKSQKREFFEKLVADRLGADALTETPLDWSSPRVICIAESYSRFDIDTVQVVPLRIELLRYRFYEGDIFALERELEPTDGSAVGDRNVATAPTAPVVTVPSLDMLLTKAGEPTRKIFRDLQGWINSLDDSVEERVTQAYVAYRMTRGFAEVQIGRDRLKIYLRPLAYVDPDGMVEQVPKSYNWTLNRRIHIASEADFERAKPIIEQSYRDVL